MRKAPEIETGRLLLRAVRTDDASDIYGYVRNPNVLRYTTGNTPREFSETEAFVRGLANKPDGAFAWAIRKKGHPPVIGVVEFGVESDGATGQVDYALAEEFWNRGFMTEAVRAVLHWAFSTIPDLERVRSSAMTVNAASTRVQEKCGMVLVRQERQEWQKFPEPVELALCEITREEWRAAEDRSSRRDVSHKGRGEEDGVESDTQTKVIVIGGAPGCGKSTLAAQLRDLLRGPWIDFGKLREFHLERDWSNQSAEEETMAFENLVSIVRNYVRHGYRNIIVDDLRDDRVQQVPRVLDDIPVRILTLVLPEPSELRRRIISRNDGWRDDEAAVEWNQRVIARACVRHEVKIDATGKSPADVLDEALRLLSISRGEGE